MIKNPKVLVRSILALIFTSLTFGASAGPYGIPDEPTWGRAIVIGTLSDLKDFEQKFKEVLGDSNLWKHQIGCTEGCAQLADVIPPPRLVYVFPREHRKIFAHFGTAWDVTQRIRRDNAFKITIDGDVPPPDCGLPHPQPCQPMSFCSDGCGRKPLSSSSCQAC